MARVVVKIPSALDPFNGDPFFQKIFMDVDQTATREDFLELVAIELIQARTATDHDRLDIEVIQCVCDSMKKNTVIGRDFFGLVILPCCTLGIATA